MNRDKIVDELNELLALEYAAYISYNTAAEVVEGDHAPYWSGLFTKMGADELEHAKEVRARIAALGGTPTVQAAGGWVEADPIRFLERSLEVERDAHKRYLSLFKRIPVEHLVLKETIEHIAKDEERAVEELTRLLAPKKK